MKMLSDKPFHIELESLYWIKNDGADDPDDLCLHGHVSVIIGGINFEYDATVSAAGLYLLRTLTENHIIHEGESMLPCCGNSMIANEDLSAVDIFGCPNGLDWSVIHEDGKVKLFAETGKSVTISLENYEDEVFAFANSIESYCNKCLPKNFPAEEAERNGYTAFWNEWKRRKNSHISYQEKLREEV